MAALRNVYFWVLSSIAGIGFYGFAYVFQRSDGAAMYGCYCLLFALGLALTMMAVKKEIHWVQVFAAGLLFRGLFLLATPQLSDDYFRFTWDGELQKDGVSSFAFLPQDYASYFAHDTLQLEKYEALYKAHSDAFPDGMNSRQYYSIYPTVSQTVFEVSGLLGTPNNGNLLVMRVFLILAEVASFFLLLALLQSRQLDPGLVGLFWLNPLIIIEVAGNLHFDGLATTFILLTLYLLNRSEYSKAGIALALAICTKLNPLFLAGALFRKVQMKTFLLFGSVTVITSLLLLSFTLDFDTFWNFKKSFGLYFAWFEFNTGPYYFLREVGWLVTDKDISPYISLTFPYVTMLLFAIVLWNPKTDLAERFLWLYLIYFSFSPIVHPWYIVVLVPLAVLSRKLYPLLWSLLIFFSYSHYREPFGEALGVVFLEYGLVYGLVYLESRRSCSALERFKYWFFQVRVD